MRIRLTVFASIFLHVLTGCAERADVEYQAVESPLIANDISNQRVSAFAEDQFGHIWMATFRGLNCFNVHEFHQHFCTDDPNTLPDNQIQSLYVDSRDRLWVSTVNGMALYTEQGNFERIPMETLSRNSIQIMEDRSGKIYVNTSISLCVFDEVEREFVNVIDELDPSRSSLIRQCFMTPSGDLLVATSTSLRKYDTATMTQKDSVALENYPTCFNITQDGTLWMSSYAGLSVCDADSMTFGTVPSSISSHPVFRKSSVSYIYPFRDSSIIFSTEKDGLFIFNASDGTFKHQSETGFPFSVPDVKISCMFEDSRHNLWIGTYDQGYHVVYDYESRFNNDSWLKSNIGHKSVVSVDRDSKDNLWISTLKDGLYLYNSEKELFQRIDLRRLFGFDGSDRMDISYVFVDRDDNIWLTGGGGVSRCRFDGSTLTVDKSWPVFFPMAMSQDACGRVWMGAFGEYVHYVSPDDDMLRSLKVMSSYYTFTPYSLPLDNGDILAASFQHGLSEIYGEDLRVRQLSFEESMWKKCIRRSVFVPSCMYQGSEDVVWIGTVANGLLKYDLSDGTLSPVPGAPCQDIASIEEDLQGNLWVSTQYGLGKYDLTSGKFVNWSASDGIGGNQFYDRASCRLSDGTLVFGGTHGLTMFNPIDVMQYRDVSVYFEDLKVHNKLVRPGVEKCIDKALPHLPDIRLSHEQNSFSISFAAVEYGEYERVDYQYMLDGFDDHWIDAHNNREAYYSNIPAGKYEFKVKVTNRDQTAVVAENAIKVIIEPSRWLSWWAVLIYVLCLTGFTNLVIRFRRQIQAEKNAKLKAQQEKEQEKKVNDMNMNFFSNISHEFRTPLTMISGPVTQLQESEGMSSENKRLLDIVQRNIRRMLRLVNQMLDFNKLENESLKLQVKPIDVIVQLRNLTDIFQVTAVEKGVTFRTYGLEDSLVIWADDDKLDKICFNLLSNAMKFTQAGGKVEFGLDVISRDEASRLFEMGEKDVDNRYMKIVVRDTGTGIPEDQLEKVFERYYQLERHARGAYNFGTGIGLYFARTLARMHHGYLKAGNQPEGTGTIFTLLLPVSESSYSESEKCSSQESDKNSPFRISSVRYSEVMVPVSDQDRKKVLIVDDDADVIHYMKELLAPYYDVISRFNADDAYTLMKEEAVDVLISDVVMPGKNGYELCRQIKDNIQISHIPVILLTAKATVDDQVQGLGCGADAYVTKPFEPQYLLALIQSQLSNREKIRSLLGHSTEVETLEEDALSPQDSAFMSELYQLMENELSNSELDVARMTEMLHISRTKFYYKVKGLTGDNPSVFFKKYKLNRAAQLLGERKYNVSEIADMTGFSTLSHFSTSFKKQFGVSPSEYVK